MVGEENSIKPLSDSQLRNPGQQGIVVPPPVARREIPGSMQYFPSI